MKNSKNILVSTILISCIAQAAPTFELYNKADTSIGILLNGQRYIVPSKQQLPSNIDIKHPINLSLFENISTLQELERKRTNNTAAQEFIINAQGKVTAYITWNPAKSPFLYPQTGPWLGFLQKTESGLPLNKKTNVAQDQIQKTSKNNVVENKPAHNQSEPIISECCICMEETETTPIPCENKHSERICKSCLNDIMKKNAQCPICRGKLKAQ